MTLDEYAWPVARLGEGLTEMGSNRGFISPRAAVANPPPTSARTPGSLALWLEQAAAILGMEVEPVESTYPQVETLLRHGGPALIRLPTESGEPGNHSLLLLECRGDRLRVLGPDSRPRWVAVEVVRQRLCAHWEAPLHPEIDDLLAQAHVLEGRQPAVRRALLTEQLAQRHLTDCWLLRPSPSAGLWQAVRRSRALRPLVTLFSAETLQQILQVLGWALIGRGALQGHFEWVWLWAWALLLLTLLPVQMLATWAQQKVVLQGTTLLRQRMVHGALQTDPEELRHGGVGFFLDRSLAVESLEVLVLSGGFNTLLAVIQLAAAGVVLYLGVGGAFHAALLGAMLLYLLAAGWFYYRRYQAWDDAHRALTGDLVERMVGHRTRLVQEAPENRHDEEDRLLARYLAATRERDKSQLLLSGALPQLWLLLGLSSLGYWIVNTPVSATQLAVSVGGILLGLQGVSQLIQGASSLVRAAVAWEEIAPIEREAVKIPAAGAAPGLLLAAGSGLPADGAGATTADGQIPLLTSHQLSFRYRAGETPVLNGCDIVIRQGERLLLEGASGGGKSTLASLLAGVRKPDGGLLLFQGYDLPTLGEENWRRQVVLAPQFHDNFVFTGSLAFNLLLGRRWPPLAEDVQEAEEVCRELGLGGLLERMPGGLMQEVGESGWQLSHGERSRLFMARALLQGANLLVLDESFAALDPENLAQALECVWRRAPTLLVIAHP